jgi:hypothetical protein
MARVRRRYRVVVLAALVAALVVPVGFALSVSAGAGRAGVVRSETPAASVAIASPAAIITESTEGSFFAQVDDSARLFVVGMMLVAVAIAVRRAV